MYGCVSGVGVQCGALVLVIQCMVGVSGVGVQCGAHGAGLNGWLVSQALVFSVVLVWLVSQALVFSVVPMVLVTNIILPGLKSDIVASTLHIIPLLLPFKIAPQKIAYG